MSEHHADFGGQAVKNERKHAREAALMLAVMASAIITAVLIWFGIIYGIGVLVWYM